ncbi:hypothetical protein FSP39_001847, partial [Pinctada imbricata]
TTKLVCYYSLPSALPINDPLPPGLNATLCTHILYIGTGVNSTGQFAVANVNHTKLFSLTIPVLRKQNPSIVILLTNGGGGSTQFSVILGSAKNRTRFITSVIPFLRQYDFDGFDLDFEFPGWNGLPESQIHSFSLLMKEFRESFESDARVTGKKRLLLTAAVAASFVMMYKIYEFDYLDKYLDLVNLMGYDFNGFTWTSPFTAFNSPLFPEEYDIKYFRTNNLAFTANEYVKNHIPKSKLMVGIPTYSHAYKLLFSRLHDIRAPAVGRGECDSAPYICSCTAIQKKKATRVWDDAAKVPYIYYGNQWVSYEDKESIKEKVNWIKSNGFGGVMVYDLNADDYQGLCDGRTKYPLISLTHKLLFGTL